MGDVEYTFKHALTLEVGYNSVLAQRRRLLHERAAQAIEALFSDRLEDHLAELAHHYDRSGNVRKAVEYLWRAGRLAAQQTAHSEAVSYFKRALELLKNLPDGTDRGQQEFDLQMALNWSLFILNPAGPEREAVLIRARELAEQLGEDAKQMEALLQLAHFRMVRREYGVGRELAQRLLGLAELAQAPAMAVGAHFLLGAIAYYLGQIEASREHLELAVALLGRGPFRNFGEARYAAFAAAFRTTTLLVLGYPAAALRKSREFLDAMRRLSDPAFLAGPCCGRLSIMYFFETAGPPWSEPKNSLRSPLSRECPSLLQAPPLIEVGPWPMRGGGRKVSPRCHELFRLLRASGQPH
jgi:tetratricopeptide (TPR) repeat protein